jgi:hypothetical protein
VTFSKEPVTGTETTVIGLFLAAAGCRMAERLSNEDVVEDVAVMDVGTTVKKYHEKMLQRFKRMPENWIPKPFRQCN